MWWEPLHKVSRSVVRFFSTIQLWPVVVDHSVIPHGPFIRSVCWLEVRLMQIVLSVVVRSCLHMLCAADIQPEALMSLMQA